MSKQKRPPGRQQAETVRSAQQAGERDLAEQRELGNLELVSRLPELDSGGDAAGVHSVRDAAFPMVERAQLALEIEPRSPDQVDRFVALLERSHLPPERREVLVDKLRGDQESAAGVQAALDAAFGGHDAEVREAVAAALDRVWEALASATIDEAAQALVAGDVEVRLSDDDGALGPRAEALIGRVAEAVAPELAAYAPTGVGAAVRSLCTSVLLLLRLEEEEEEELLDGELEVGEL